MQYQEAIQLLEEMNLPESYKCPNCNEVLIRKIRQIKGTIFICDSCKFYFKVITCKICKKKKYSHKLGVCYDCFTKSEIWKLQQIKENQFGKLILISSRKKPDLAFAIDSKLWNKLDNFSQKRGIKKKEVIIEAVKRFIRLIH